MKRVVTILLCLFLLSGTILSVSAVESRDTTCVPTLTFDGTTAKCKASFSSFGNSISLTLSLWDGDTLVESWMKTGTSYVSINETCGVASGRTYTLKVGGTYGGVTFPETSVTKKCP